MEETYPKLKYEKILNTYKKNGIWFYSQVYKSLRVYRKQEKRPEYFVFPVDYPDTDGWDLMKLIQEGKALKLVKDLNGLDIVTTDYATDISRGISSGFGYIRLNPKPITEQDLEDLYKAYNNYTSIPAKKQKHRFNKFANKHRLKFDEVKKTENPLYRLNEKVNNHFTIPKSRDSN